MNNASLINQTSGRVEYGTPKKIIKLVHEFFGGPPDLDPACSEAFQSAVGALNFFDKDTNGLNQDWFGRVWLNHPFGKPEEPCKNKCKKRACVPIEETRWVKNQGRYSLRDGKLTPANWRGRCIDERIPGNPDWINKFIREFERGNIREGLCITYAATSEDWFRLLLDWPQCSIYGRTNYTDPQGNVVKGVTKGSVITYIGYANQIWRFSEIFNRIGKVKV